MCKCIDSMFMQLGLCMHGIHTSLCMLFCMHIEMGNSLTTTRSQVVYLQSKNAGSTCNDNEVRMQ